MYLPELVSRHSLFTQNFSFFGPSDVVLADPAAVRSNTEVPMVVCSCFRDKSSITQILTNRSPNDKQKRTCLSEFGAIRAFAYARLCPALLVLRRLLDGAGARLAPENERAAVGRGDDIHRAVPVQVYRQQLGASARAVVDQLGDKLRASGRLGIPSRPVPIQYGRAVRIGIVIIVLVRPVALAHYDVRNAVSIHVG